MKKGRGSGRRRVWRGGRYSWRRYGYGRRKRRKVREVQKRGCVGRTIGEVCAAKEVGNEGGNQKQPWASEQKSNLINGRVRMAY